MAPSPARRMTRLPSGESSVVFCTDRVLGPKILAVGPTQRAFYKLASAIPFYTRVTFRPGAARAFFGVTLHELTDRVVPIHELWGQSARNLLERLADANGAVGRTVALLESALLERLASRSPDLRHRSLVERTATALDSDLGEPEPIRALADRFGVSGRSLRQMFREEVGLSPKRYARIARIRRAVAKAGRTSWAHLAAEEGFYDQAHLSSEFRSLLGVTPGQFLAGEVPIAGGC